MCSGHFPYIPALSVFILSGLSPSLIQFVSSVEPRARGSRGHWLPPSGSHGATPTPTPRARPAGTPASPSVHPDRTPPPRRGRAHAASSPVGSGPLRALLSAWSMGRAWNSFQPLSPSLYNFLIFASRLKTNSTSSRRSKCASVSFSPEHPN